jgi:hypothetical protein
VQCYISYSVKAYNIKQNISLGDIIFIIIIFIFILLLLLVVLSSSLSLSLSRAVDFQLHT